ncbi:hypothetical protein H0H92_003947 [Tricholoma furcatifolium]|nr:hypothetical protein H0H92_003947 [Tricholoma furcatifolium]
MSRDEIKKALLQLPQLNKNDEELIAAKGEVAIGFDASSMFCDYVGSTDDSWTQQVLNRCEDLHMELLSIERIFQTKVSDQTTISAKTRLSQYAGSRLTRQLVGTLSIGLIPAFAKVSAKYETNGTLLSGRIVHSLARSTPAVTITASRQLYPLRSDVAFMELDVSATPKYTFKLNFSSMGVSVPSPLPTISGLKDVSSETSIGVSFQSILPTLIFEQAVNLVELATQLTFALNWTAFMGFECVCSGTWVPRPQVELSFTTRYGLAGVSLALSIAYEGNVFSIPVSLAAEPEPSIAYCATILPTTIALLGYHLIVKPRRRKHRLDFIHAARSKLQESGELRRDREATLAVLTPTAKKSKTAESAKGGLVITEATWGCFYEEDAAKDLYVDVTVPLQALVRKSQVFVPSDRSKSAIPGFGDPAPFARKVLRVRYLFRDQTHYAEIREDFSVVLPSAVHLVEEKIG